MKKVKALKSAHTPNTKTGMGDFYGTGVKQKTGKMREDFLNNSVPSSKKIGKPPKKLA